MLSAVTTNFLGKVRQSGHCPSQIQLSEFEGGYMATWVESQTDQVINFNSYCGMHPQPSTALMKCVSEYFERRAMSFEAQVRRAIVNRHGTDGLAAFPILNNSLEATKKACKSNALHEAFERFVWATWWDNHDVAFSQSFFSVDSKTAFKSVNQVITELKILLPVKELVLISPSFCTTNKVLQDSRLLIWFAFLESGGVLSGGAAGARNDLKNTAYRGIVELLRHGSAYNKMMKRPGYSKKSFYEKRLEYFASGRGRHLVNERLQKRGSKAIYIPNLAIDEEVIHDLGHLYYIHRCLFENQPQFIGGKLERLCL